MQQHNASTKFEDVLNPELSIDQQLDLIPDSIVDQFKIDPSQLSIGTYILCHLMWIISKKFVSMFCLDNARRLGTGHFGKVVTAQLTLSSGETKQVAVKQMIGIIYYSSKSSC